MALYDPEMDVDLLDGDFYANDPYPTYAWLRENQPLYWDATNELWGVSRYDDIEFIEKHAELFINSDQKKGGYRPNIPADPAIIGLDDPEHRKRRNLVARRFTPRAVGSWEAEVRDTVNALFDGGRGQRRPRRDHRRLAAPLPAKMIGKLLGLPERGVARPPELVRAHDHARRRPRATTSRTGSSRRWSSRRRPRTCTRRRPAAPPTT